jgi:tetratricopeptide (TPR) repeat protein
MKITPKITPKIVLLLLLLPMEAIATQSSSTIAALAPVQPTATSPKASSPQAAPSQAVPSQAAPVATTPPGVTQEQMQTFVQQNVQDGLSDSQADILREVETRVDRRLGLTFGLLNALLVALLVALLAGIVAFWFWRRSLVSQIRNELEEKLHGALKAELEREVLDLAYPKEISPWAATIAEEPAQLKEMISLAMSVQNLVDNTRSMLEDALQKQNQFAAQMRDLFEYQTQEAQNLMQAGQYSEAIELYDKALQLKAADPSVLRSQAEGFLQLHRYEEAIAAFDRAAESDAENPEIWYAKARCYALQGNSGESIFHLKRAIQLDPKVKEQARAEIDFASIREDEWFQTTVVG